MIYARKRRAPAKKGVKRNYRRPAKRVARRSTFVKKVQAIIHRNLENKTYQANGFGYNIINSAATGWAANCFGTLPMTPAAGFLQIDQSTGQGGRIGDKISIRKLTFSGVIYPAKYNVSTNGNIQPQEVKFWLVTQKDTPNVQPTGYTKFFQFGTTSGGFDGTLIDMIKKPNQDLFMIHTTRTFKVGYGEYFGTGNNATAQYYNNNDFKLNHKFSIDVTKYAVKDVKYNDSTLTPMTRGVFLVCEAVYANGSTISSVNEIPVLMDWQLSVTYEDA